MRSDYKIYDSNYIYFLTSTIVQWLPVFTSKKFMDIIIDSLVYCQDYKELSLFAYVIMDNHIHLIAQAPDLSKTMQSFGRHTAKKIIEQLKIDKKDWLLYLFEFYKKQHKNDCQHQVWQEGLHPKQLPTRDILSQKMEYIHYNPVKRGLIEKPEDWMFSSARNYILGDDSMIKLAELDPF